MKIIIFLCGIHSIALAIFHILFWKIFDWKNDLTNLNVANRAIIQILNSRIIYFFFFVAFLCFIYPQELLTSTLGKVMLAGISVFWLGRTIEQFVFLRVQNKFANILTVIFIIGAVLFSLPLIVDR